MAFLLAILSYMIIGILAGFLAGLLGIGGGLITVPSLLLIFHLLDFPTPYAMQMAVGTSLGAMVFTAASSAWAHYKQKGVNWHLFNLLTPGIVIGALLGAIIADELPSKQLALLFGCFICLIGLYFLLPSKSLEERNCVPPHFLMCSVVAIFIGAISTILGIGGGMIIVPMLTAFHTPLRNAISTSAVIGFFIAFIGALSFLYLGLKQQTSTESLGYLYMPAFIFISLTSSISAPFGAKLAHALPTAALKRIFGIVLIIVGILMVYP